MVRFYIVTLKHNFFLKWTRPTTRKSFSQNTASVHKCTHLDSVWSFLTVSAKYSQELFDALLVPSPCCCHVCIWWRTSEDTDFFLSFVSFFFFFFIFWCHHFLAFLSTRIVPFDRFLGCRLPALLSGGDSDGGAGAGKGQGAVAMATENFKILVYSAEILQINCQTVAAAKTMACRPCIFALRSTQAYGVGLTGCEGNCLPAVYKKFAQN